ncbi:TetR family transcriptional regulator [Streptomyces sp. TRM43335]|uniref:TetR family transcriptional regulator n=1 Tax=Streptomyces taklimakanensis TaxID=2569853 RepID=A0A6G2BJZ4_9ACTN|nr:TetR/AcrR family transcriptional regulator [Streptomyces taklimakanensis]MTE22436.1 TetR family transcriptional regulator [Streptomyces taklimakanensis]
MARVSQAHLDARRQQIITGARRCFTRNGFHATSMQDVFKETDLSAGAVYRYFGSKEELIQAVAVEAFTSMREAFAGATRDTPTRPLDEVLSGVLSRVLEEQAHRAGTESTGAFAKLILQVWGESLRNEPLAITLRQGYEDMHVVWSELVRTYQRAGRLPADVTTDHVVRTLMALAQGFIVQQALFGDASSEILRNGLHTLMTANADVQ